MTAGDCRAENEGLEHGDRYSIARPPSCGGWAAKGGGEQANRPTGEFLGEICGVFGWIRRLFLTVGKLAGAWRLGKLGASLTTPSVCGCRVKICVYYSFVGGELG